MDLLAVQGTLKSLLQHHSLKTLVLRCSAFFMDVSFWGFIQFLEPAAMSFVKLWKVCAIISSNIFVVQSIFSPSGSQFFFLSIGPFLHHFQVHLLCFQIE